MSVHPSRSEQIAELAVALCGAQAEFVAIPKTELNPFFKSHYAGLPQVVEAASPILTKHGLAVSQFPGSDEHGDTLTTWLLHKSGQFLCQSMRLHLTKQDAQGQGSALTYARRYSYMAVLGLVADEDDDGNAASKPRQQPARANGQNGGSEKATAEDVALMRSAADGLDADQIKLALAACGVEGVKTFNSVPREKVGPFVKALAGIDRA